MKTRPRQIVVLVCLILLAAYFFLTPIGALRGAIALSGHPIDAVMLQARIASAEDVGLVNLDNPPNSIIYRITKHIPYYKETGAEAKNWIIIKTGPVCIAKYYGWL